MASRSASALLLGYSAAFAVLLLLPPFLGFGRGLHPDMRLADLVDLVTPTVLIPLAWLVFSAASPRTPSRGQTVAFLVVAVLWVLGHGMHLAANSIGNLIADTAPLAAAPLRDLVHFYDEVLSHYLWHAGVVGLAAVTVRRAWDSPPQESSLPAVIASAAVYGFTLFLITVEGGSVPLVLPAAALLVAALAWRRMRAGELHAAPAMFLAAHALTLALLVIWAVWHRGFPQFSELGWL